MHTPFHYFLLNGHTVCDLQNVLKEMVLGWGPVFPDVLCMQAGDAAGWVRGGRMQGEKQCLSCALGLEPGVWMVDYNVQRWKEMSGSQQMDG